MGYFAPTTLPEAVEVLSRELVKIIAGGTDFFPALKAGQTPEHILNVTRISGLSGITETPSGWRIGAGTRWSDIVCADLPACFDSLKAAAREVGSVQIQNSGTIAGNLCNASPAADGVPPLLVLDATVEVQSTRGGRTLPLRQFIKGVRSVDLAADEIVTAVFVPKSDTDLKSSFQKLGSRHYLVISIVMVSVAVSLDDQKHIRDIRISVGACSPVAQRLQALEHDLIGRPVGDVANFAILDRHLEVLSPIDDVRASAEYRRTAVETLTRRAIQDVVAHG